MKEKESLLPSTDLAKQLDGTVASVLQSSSAIQGFERMFVIGEALAQLKAMLTPERMKPIMSMQGNKLGFRTDKDDKGGYDLETVKNCLLEAVLIGVQPFGNQFNIISGGTYITREGFGHLLSKVPGLTYEISPQLPRIKEDKSGAAVKMNIEWTLNGITKSKEIDFPIKSNAYASSDSILGKATRKARHWLYNNISGTGVEIPEGDVLDVDHKVVVTKTQGDKEEERIEQLILSAKDIKSLSSLQPHVTTDKLKGLYEKRESELITK